MAAAPAQPECTVVTEAPSLAPARMAMLRVDGQGLTVADALAREDWRVVPASALNIGFTSDTIWLTGTLCNPSQAPVTRWLAVGAARLQSVSFFRMLPNGTGPAQTILAGNTRPIAARPVKALLPIFPITLAPGERIQWVLKVYSASAVEIIPTLWEPAAYRQSEGEDLVGAALLTAIALLAAVFSVLQAWSWRDRSFLLLAIWMGLALLYAMASQGYLYRFIFDRGGPWALRAPATLGTLASVCYAAVTLAFVGLERVRLWNWVYRLFIVLLLLGALWTAFGDYRSGTIYSNGIILFFYASWFVSLLDAWRRHLTNARVFLIAYAPVWIVVVLNFLQLYAVVDWPPLRSVHTSWLPGLCVIGMVGALATRRSAQMYAAHAAALDAFLDAHAAEQTRLENAVLERTTELRAALALAHQANRAKADFLASISHDLRTPLTTILGFAELLQCDGAASAERARMIRSSAQHMLTMVNNLIDYARGHVPDPHARAAVYLYALLDTVAQAGAELARRHGNRFAFRIDAEAPPVVVLDAEGLYRALVNLLDNASKYTSDGDITLAVAVHQGGAPEPSVTLHFQVSDTGPGIAPENHRSVLEPFKRLANAQGKPGIGMGLAITQQWVSAQGGTLRIESELGAGTTVHVTVRSRVASEADVPQHHLAAVRAQGRDIDGAGRLIWVADDTADIRHLLEDHLCTLGFTVEVFQDGLAVIERMSAPLTCRPDLLLTDHLMPRADGLELLGAARAWRPDLPVVLLSALPYPVAGEAPLRRPTFDAVLRKPIDFSELQSTLAHLLGLHSGDLASKPGTTARIDGPARTDDA
ncbi:hypothetical protein AB870_24595 (plasmid) [Pandoraea faecigallinarum]|uniref:histidine kinase n=1 Tax=Pandoraea faecigallinarum TaxID=656179 RepID=A0A173H057_9BURK|nr:hybrid sensor histidine kinase/response regulator [Pandoraea faecigallinarum]ANI21814.1 hypothetical protein AB870_24595 [Pandoraea faecigallinarum]